MDDYTQSMAVFLLPGMSVDIKMVWDPTNNKAVRGRGGAEGTYNGQSLINGFLVVNSDVGSISALEGEGEYGVKYRHYKSMPNTVMFYGDDHNVRVAIQVMSVPIHDHSSIVQGGPAFGTYFTDSEED